MDFGDSCLKGKESLPEISFKGMEILSVCEQPWSLQEANFDSEGNIYLTCSNEAIWLVPPHIPFGEQLDYTNIDISGDEDALDWQLKQKRNFSRPDALGSPGYIWVVERTKGQVLRINTFTGEAKVFIDASKEKFSILRYVVGVFDSFGSYLYVVHGNALAKYNLEMQQWHSLGLGNLNIFRFFHPSTLTPLDTLPAYHKSALRYDDTYTQRLTKEQQELKKTKHRFTWIHTTRYKGDTIATSLLNLDTGDITRLYNFELYPLVTFDERLTLVAKKEVDHVSFMVVDWTPNAGDDNCNPVHVGYIEDRNRMKVVGKILEGKKESIEEFHYCHTTNCLFFILDNKPVRVDNFITNWAHIMQEESYNLKKLLKLSPNGKSIKSDALVVNNASGVSWSIVESAIALHVEKEKREEFVNRVKFILEESELPPASLTLFVEYLHFSGIGRVAPNDVKEKTKEILDVIDLCDMVEVNVEYLRSLLFRRLLPATQAHDVADILVRRWAHEFEKTRVMPTSLSKVSPTIALLIHNIVWHKRRAIAIDVCSQYAFPKVQPQEEPSPSSGGENTELHGPLEQGLVHLLTIANSSTLKVPPLVIRRQIFKNFPKEELCWENSLTLEYFVADLGVPKSVGNYLITTEMPNQGGIIVPEWLLYAHWKFFRRLISENQEEVLTHIIRMPPWCTPTIILLIIATMYHQLPNFVNHHYIALKEIENLNRRAAELDLDRGTTFEPLLAWCQCRLTGDNEPLPP